MRLDGEAVVNCLDEIPFNSNLSASLIDEVVKYVQFQSTLDELKSKTILCMCALSDLVQILQMALSRSISWEV